jgi:hypothetical protein
MKFTPEQRAELRAAVDQSRREALAESARLQREAIRLSQVARAARKAQRAQEASTLAPQLLSANTVKPSGRCRYCGTPAGGDVCAAHIDLAATDVFTTAGAGSSLGGSSADARRNGA